MTLPVSDCILGHKTWGQTTQGLCFLDLHVSPAQECKRPVSLKRLRANHA